MTSKELELVIKYFYNKDQFLKNDIVTYSDRYRLRNCDQVDHLESIIAITRFEAFTEFRNELSHLLKISPYDNIGNADKKL